MVLPNAYLSETKINLNNNMDDISLSIEKIANHLDTITNPQYKPFLLIDDLDYVEDQWKDVIGKIVHFVSSSKISIGLTIRPRLFAKISNDDRISRHFSESNLYNLTPISIREILISRIFIILNEYHDFKEKQKESVVLKMFRFIASIFDHGISAEKYIINALKALGIDEVSKISKIAYPFHSAFEEFMEKITDYNLRRMFLIAKDSFAHYNKNGKPLEENTSGYWKLNKDVIRDLFFRVEKPEVGYSVINIHKKRSQKTMKSIYYYILEVFFIENTTFNKEVNICDSTFLNKIQFKIGGGINQKDLINDIRKLSKKDYALLNLVKNRPNNDKFDISKKGRYYYMEICQWKEYQEIFGTKDTLLE